jgi:hypothetical protein
LTCPGGNEALAADIQKVVEQLERLLAPKEQQAAASEGAGHVLLAGYSRGLH